MNFFQDPKIILKTQDKKQSEIRTAEKNLKEKVDKLKIQLGHLQYLRRSNSEMTKQDPLQQIAKALQGSKRSIEVVLIDIRPTQETITRLSSFKITVRT